MEWQAACEAKLLNDAEVWKYFKMKKFGISPKSILQKMSKDGVPDAKIETFAISCGIFG
jgi:hypothetical protein